MKVLFEKIDENAITPTYASSGSAGADLYNYCQDVVIKSHESAVINLGFKMEIPNGYVGLIFARSGLACKQGLAPANKVGVVDCDYRGEFKIVLFNHSNEDRVIKKGERIAQLVIVPYLTAEFEQGQLSNTTRGEGGFGSTGK